MFKSKFTRLKRVAMLACGVFYAIHKMNVELVKFVATKIVVSELKNGHDYRTCQED